MDTLPKPACEKIRQKILIVDDLKDNLRVMNKLIKPLDVDIVTAESGDEALKKISQNNFAVIILDVVMPGMDGYEVARKIKETSGSCETPIIFITGYEQDIEKILQGYQSGAIDFILKPFIPQVLTSKVKVLLEIDQKIHDLERQRAELKKSETEHLKELKITQFAVDNLQDAVYWADMQGCFTYVNDQACKELGYSKAELLRLYIWDVDAQMQPEDWPGLIQEIRNRGGNIYERNHVRKDGTQFAAEIKTIYLEIEGNALVCGFSHNITERNRDRDKILSSERLLSKIIDTIPIRVFWKDRHSTFLGCNLAFAQDSGFDHSKDIIGKTDHDLPLNASQIENYCADDQAVMEKGIPRLDSIEKLNRPGKPPRWVKTNKIPLIDLNGDIIGVLGTYEDITESKQMQEAIEKQIVALTRPLEENEEISFDELFNIKDIQRIQDEFAAATNVASIITRPNGTPITQPSNFTDLCAKIIRKNPKGCVNCMISDAETGKDHSSGPVIRPCLSAGLWDAGANITVGGKHIATWLIGQVRDETQTDEKILAYAREIGADEQAVIRAFHRVPKMSKERFEHIASALYTLANQLSTSAYQNIQQARFIANEKRRTKELRRLSTALEQSPEVIVITDKDGVIEYANPAFERTTGYTSAEAIGKNASILSSGKHSDEFYRTMWQTLSSGEVWTGHIVNKKMDGTLYTEEAVISPVKSPEGAITNYVAIKRDITQDLIQEEQMQNAQRMESVGQLAGGIAHDFNNILQSIMGFSDLLMLTLSESLIEPRENVQEIQKAAQHAAELTRQLLAFSRKQHVNFSTLNLNTSLLKTLKFLNSIIGENIRVVTDLSPEPPLVNADAGQLERAVLNMVINARDAMPRGGVLTLRTEKIVFADEESLISPYAHTGNYACLSICDTGTGISPDVIDHIFEPFFTTKPTGSGTGLGLAASYGIIRKHDGWIDVESPPEEGTTFKIYLPALLADSNAHNETETENTSSLPPKASGQRILIVEDADALRILSETILREAGYHVVSTSNAEDAEALFEKENGNFQLLFSDVILPDKNGADLGVSLQEKKPDLRVLLCSGYSGNRIEQVGANLKDFHFLEKPFTISKLLNLVKDILADVPV